MEFFFLIPLDLGGNRAISDLSTPSNIFPQFLKMYNNSIILPVSYYLYCLAISQSHMSVESVLSTQSDDVIQLLL